MLLNPHRHAVWIRLTHKSSEVEHLCIEYEHHEVGKGFSHGLIQRPEAFVYSSSSSKVNWKPWLCESVPNPHDYPWFNLTTETGEPETEEEWNNRNTLLGFGTAEGTARLIQLLLDMSRRDCTVWEFLLESEAGFRGVAPASAEIRFWLPGGDVPDSEFP